MSVSGIAMRNGMHIHKCALWKSFASKLSLKTGLSGKVRGGAKQGVSQGASSGHASSSSFFPLEPFQVLGTKMEVCA